MDVSFEKTWFHESPQTCSFCFASSGKVTQSTILSFGNTSIIWGSRYQNVYTFFELHHIQSKYSDRNKLDKFFPSVNWWKSLLRKAKLGFSVWRYKFVPLEAKKTIIETEQTFEHWRATNVTTKTAASRNLSNPKFLITW